jgi:hypothetical protein
MKSKQLYMVSEELGGPEWLTTDKSYCIHDRPAEPHEVTLEAMADMLDQDAESANAHEFCGCHRALAALVYQESGRDAATRVMRRLVDFDGLQGVVGACGCGPSEKTVAKALGVSMNSSKKWRLGP